jgi:hypothetical protein
VDEQQRHAAPGSEPKIAQPVRPGLEHGRTRGGFGGPVRFRHEIRLKLGNERVDLGLADASIGEHRE